MSPCARVRACVRPEVVNESKIWFNLAWPLGLSTLSFLLSEFISVSFLGHLGTEYLAAASVATLWTSVSSTWLTQGFSVSLSALVGQALGGESPKTAGGWYQLALVGGTCLLLPVAGLWALTGTILDALHYSSSVVHLGRRIALYNIICLPASFYVQLTNVYLQAQRLVAVPAAVGVASVPLTVATNYWFIYGCGSWDGLGYIGSPVAMAVTQWLLLVGLVLYAFVYRGLHRATWPGWHWRFFTRRRFRQYTLEQALPAGLSVFAEELPLCFISYAASKLGAAQISAHNALTSLLLVLSSLSFGVMDATTVRVAFHLGADDVPMSKAVGWVSFACSFSLGVVVSVLLTVFANHVPYIFTHDSAVVAQARPLVHLLAITYLFLSVFFSCMAVLSGQGRQLIQMVAFVMGTWVVCLPLAYCLCYVLHQDLKGLWLALVVGYAVVGVISAVGVWCTNYPAVVAAAKERNEPGSVKVLPDVQEATPLLSSVTAATPDVDTATATSDTVSSTVTAAA